MIPNENDDFSYILKHFPKCFIKDISRKSNKYFSYVDSSHTIEKNCYGHVDSSQTIKNYILLQQPFTLTSNTKPTGRSGQLSLLCESSWSGKLIRLFDGKNSNHICLNHLRHHCTKNCITFCIIYRSNIPGREMGRRTWLNFGTEYYV